MTTASFGLHGGPRPPGAAGKAFAELTAIDRSKLSSDDAVNYDIFRNQLAEGIASWELARTRMPINADSGFHSDFSGCRRSSPWPR